MIMLENESSFLVMFSELPTVSKSLVSFFHIPGLTQSTLLPNYYYYYYELLLLMNFFFKFHNYLHQVTVR